jgi:hypothetical protein
VRLAPAGLLTLVLAAPALADLAALARSLEVEAVLRRLAP